MIDHPAFWKTDLETIDQLAKRAKRAQTKVLAHSAGGRPMHMFCYGEKQPIQATANYSSACGAFQLNCYKPTEDKKPVVLLLGAEHGAEVEGTAALINLLHLLEDGHDLKGDENPALLEDIAAIRLVVIPVCNPDGRARFPHASALGMTMEEQRYFFQGTWKDGSLCDYPKCKTVHPIKDASEHIGSYFNDDGVNLVHDNFFHPMARETQALLDLADAERADYMLHLHGGSNSYNVFLPTNYQASQADEAILALAARCDLAARKEDLAFHMGGRPKGPVPPTFNLMSAMHHVCGGVSVTFESNQHVADWPGAKLTHEQVYRSHMILFEELVKAALGK